MKKHLITFAIIGASALIGCSKSDPENHSASAQTDTNAMAAHEHSTMNAGTMEDRMQSMNAEMVQQLGAADANYDHRFIDMMIPHHEGAILMAKDALQKSQRPEIKKLAEDIIAAQEKEIAQLKAWGEAWYHKH